jgi:hypothetical protein
MSPTLVAPIAHESECAAMPSHLRDPRLTRWLARHVVRPSKSRTSSGPGPLASIAQFALAQGTPLAGGDGADRVLIQPQGAYYIFVQHSNAAGGDSAHSQLVVPRYTEPTDEKHNERCRQCRGYLIGYGHPSTGQRQRFTRIRDDLRGEASARIAPVSNPC